MSGQGSVALIARVLENGTCETGAVTGVSTILELEALTNLLEQSYSDPEQVVTLIQSLNNTSTNFNAASKTDLISYAKTFSNFNISALALYENGVWDVRAFGGVG